MNTAEVLAQDAVAPQQPARVAAAGPVQLTIAAAETPQPARDAGANRGPNCTGAMREPSHVSVPIGKSTMLNMPEPVRSRSLGNPGIVQAMLVSPQTLYLLGLETGTTNMIVQGRSGSCSVIDVTVGMDPSGLQNALRDLMPEARDLRVTAAADSLVIAGHVPDALQAQKILDIANAFVLRQSRGPLQAPQQALGGQPGTTTPGMMPTSMSLSALRPGGAAGGDTPLRSPRVINMMTIDAPQQVMLEVKVAEVSKTLVDQLSMSAQFAGKFGSFGVLANFLSNGQNLIGAFTTPESFLNATHKTFTAVGASPLRGDSLVKILAEPNLMAISGQEASFLAGGKVYFPVPQSTGAGGTTITLQEETFGVALRFTPTVMANGRINLRVAPEVSELSPTGVSVSASNTNNTAILPLITTRRASTTLQVMDGQSFAIGGLIKNNVTTSIKAFPGLGEIPVLGALFRSSDFQTDRSELVFIVTPRLVQPLPADYKLPTDGYIQPSRGEFFLQGKLEGQPPSQSGPAPQQAAPAAGGFEVK